MSQFSNLYVQYVESTAKDTYDIVEPTVKDTYRINGHKYSFLLSLPLYYLLIVHLESSPPRTVVVSFVDRECDAIPFEWIW